MCRGPNVTQVCCVLHNLFTNKQVGLIYVSQEFYKLKSP